MDLGTALTIVGSIASICIVLGVKAWTTQGKGMVNLTRREVDYWKEQCHEMEQEAKYWKGRYGQTQQTPNFGEAKVTKDNLGDIINQFMPMFAEYLPKAAQPFFKVPWIQKTIAQYAMEHPEQVAGLVQKFFRGKGIASEGQTASNSGELQGLPPNSEIH